MPEPLRPSVRAFAALMERNLKNNDWKGGWDYCTYKYLVQKLKDEVDELETVIAMIDGAPEVPRSPVNRAISMIAREIPRECADVANFAMMIADVSGAMEEAPES